jgi:hypothetical protein
VGLGNGKDTLCFFLKFIFLFFWASFWNLSNVHFLFCFAFLGVRDGLAMAMAACMKNKEHPSFYGSFSKKASIEHEHEHE